MIIHHKQNAGQWQVVVRVARTIFTYQIRDILETPCLLPIPINSQRLLS